jgi:hypothetical protein
MDILRLGHLTSAELPFDLVNVTFCGIEELA